MAEPSGGSTDVENTPEEDVRASGLVTEHLSGASVAGETLSSEVAASSDREAGGPTAAPGFSGAATGTESRDGAGHEGGSSEQILSERLLWPVPLMPWSSKGKKIGGFSSTGRL
eukprot:6048683-Alexandrium_andersonii.AAC.1